MNQDLGFGLVHGTSLTKARIKTKGKTITIKNFRRSRQNKEKVVKKNLGKIIESWAVGHTQLVKRFSWS